MAFPTTQLGLRVDLRLAGVWTDITSYVRTDEDVVISRGRADEANRPDPQTCTLKLKNNDGRFSPRNPTSPYYGVLGRNTPLRVGVGTPCAATARVDLTDTATLTAGSVTAETAGMQICVWGATPVGDITTPGGFTADTERDGSLSTWRRGYQTVLAGSTGAEAATFSTTATAQAAVNVFVPGGTSIPTFVSAAGLGATADLTVPVTAGDVIIVTNGWSSDPDDDMVRPPFLVTGRPPAWVLLADSGASVGPRIKSWALRINDTDAALRVQLVALPGADNYARIDVVSGAADYFARFTGEVSTWPVAWDLSGADVATPITASGIRRRLGQGGSPPLSPLRRTLGRTANVVAYWPLEDQPGSTSFTAALGGQAMARIGAPVMAADESFKGAGPLPTFNAAGAKGSVSYASTNEYAVGTLLYVPTGLFDEATLLTIQATGTLARWTVKYDSTAGGLRLEAFDTDGVSLLNTAPGGWVPAIAGGRGYLLLEVTQNGADIDWILLRLGIQDDDTINPLQISGTIATQTAGRVSSVQLGGGDIVLDVDVVFGHVAVSNDSAGFFTAAVYDALVAWAADLTIERWSRLVADEDISMGSMALPAITQYMGVQRPRTFLELLDEAVDTDGGVLIEPKGFLGFQIRGRASKLSQPPSLTLTYTTKGHVGHPLEPVDDDQRTVNDVTVTRIDGSSSRVEQLTGPLSVLPPPAGVGRYDTGVDLSLFSDDQTADQASWKLHLGTQDEARWPSILTRLEAVPSLIPQMCALEVGDTITLTGLPAWVPPGPTDLILEGYTEHLGPFAWTWVGNYSPASGWRVMVLDSADFSRLAADGSSLTNTIGTVLATFNVTTAVGSARFITTATHPSEFPFDIKVGGEQMTVTAITNTTPQTFTVIRSVNGVVIGHDAGTEIQLAEPIYLA